MWEKVVSQLGDHVTRLIMGDDSRKLDGGCHNSSPGPRLPSQPKSITANGQNQYPVYVYLLMISGSRVCWTCPRSLRGSALARSRTRHFDCESDVLATTTPPRHSVAARHLSLSRMVIITSDMAEVMRPVRCICHSFYLSFCVQDYCKSNQPISLILGVMIGPTSRKHWLTFGGDQVPDTELRIADHFSTAFVTAELGILGDLLVFITQSPADFNDTRRNDWRRQDYEYTTFWERSADIRIGIRINPEIRIRIPDYFSLRLDTLAEVCVPWAHSS